MANQSKKSGHKPSLKRLSPTFLNAIVFKMRRMVSGKKWIYFGHIFWKYCCCFPQGLKSESDPKKTLSQDWKPKARAPLPLIERGAEATAWAKFVGGSFLTGGKVLVLSGVEFNWLRPPLSGFWRVGTIIPGEGLFCPKITNDGVLFTLKIPTESSYPSELQRIIRIIRYYSNTQIVVTEYQIVIEFL